MGRVRVRPQLYITNGQDLAAVLECWTLVARATLLRARKAGRPLPPLYKSGVRYRREPSGEQWLTPPMVLSRGQGDCEDLSVWRAAELQLKGVKAKAVPVRVRPGLIHIAVRLPNGRIEDPSKRLGMKGRG